MGIYHGESDFGGIVWFVYTYAGVTNNLKRMNKYLPCGVHYVYIIGPCDERGEERVEAMECFLNQ